MSVVSTITLKNYKIKTKQKHLTLFGFIYLRKKVIFKHVKFLHYVLLNLLSFHLIYHLHAGLEHSRHRLVVADLEFHVRPVGRLIYVLRLPQNPVRVRVDHADVG